MLRFRANDLQAIYTLCYSGKEEIVMQRRSWLTCISLILVVVILGCGAPAVKRAPIETIPEEEDPEIRIEMLEDMTAGYPEDANLYFELGNLYYDELMSTDARRNFEKAIELDPKMNKARVNLAMLLAESAEPDSAKTLLMQAIELDPDDAKAYNNLGMIYYTEMAVGEAVAYFRKAVEVDPVNVQAHYNLGLAFAESGLLQARRGSAPDCHWSEPRRSSRNRGSGTSVGILVGSSKRIDTSLFIC
jgi:tetratricopeptide (TPR) repeat protein